MVACEIVVLELFLTPRLLIWQLFCGHTELEDFTKIVKPEEALETMRWWSENPGKVFRILVKFS